MIRVLVADDQAAVRDGFAALIDAQDSMLVAGQARNGREAVDLARRVFPHVVLMDIRMPVLDGIEATRRIAARPELAGVHVVILTTFELDEYVFEGLRAGAAGFLVKDIPDDQLVAGIRAFVRGDTLLAPTVTRRLIDAYTRRSPASGTVPGAQTLTPREVEVWQLMAKGLSNTEIAAQLFVGEATVKTHVSRVMAKLGARDRVQAVVLAYENAML
jgi:DNA-binding NarL/FixJ family response regulator